MPRVTEGLCAAITAELQEGGLVYAEQILREIEAENPSVANFISKLSLRSSEKVAVSLCGVIVYVLIKR